MSSMKASSTSLSGTSGGILANLQRAFNDIEHINFLIERYHPQVDAAFDENAVFCVTRDALQNAVLSVYSDVLRKPAPAVTVHRLEQAGIEEKAATGPIQRVAPELRRIPSPLIQRIMFQITSKALDTKDADALEHAAFKLVFKSSWLRKTLALLAAFTLHYGGYWYWVQSTPLDPPAPQISALEGSKAMKAKIEKDPKINNSFTMLNDLVKDLLDLIEIIFELTRLCAKHPKRDVPLLNLVFNRLPQWNCQAVVAILAVNVQFTKFINAEEDRLLEWELQQLSLDVTSLKKKLKAELDRCLKDIAIYKSYEENVREIENPSSVVDVIRRLIREGTDTLLYGVSNKRVKIESLQGKDVLVLISTVKLGADDLEALSEVYAHFESFSKQIGLVPVSAKGQDGSRNFELIWFPFIEEFQDPLVRREGSLYDPQEQLHKFKILQAKMPWLTIEDPSQLREHANRVFAEEWHFRGDAIVVVLNQSGRITCDNAMPMIRIWGKKAYPYEHIVDVWKNTPSWIQAVFDRNPEIFTIGKYTFLYGGEDLMSRISVDAAKEIEDVTGIHIVHVTDPLIFKRIENTLICRMQYLLELSQDDHRPPDSVFDQLAEAFTAYEMGGFAILTKGPEVIFIGLAEPAVELLKNYETWYDKDVDIVKVFREHTSIPRKCVFLPSTGWWRKDWMKCKETGQNMKYVESYRCSDY